MTAAEREALEAMLRGNYPTQGQIDAQAAANLDAILRRKQEEEGRALDERIRACTIEDRLRRAKRRADAAEGELRRLINSRPLRPSVDQEIEVLKTRLRKEIIANEELRARLVKPKPAPAAERGRPLWHGVGVAAWAGVDWSVRILAAVGAGAIAWWIVQ